MSLSTMLLWRLFVAGNNSTYFRSSRSVQHFCLILTKFRRSRQIFIEVSNIKSHSKPLRGRPAENIRIDGRAVRQKDMTKLLGALRKCANGLWRKKKRSGISGMCICRSRLSAKLVTSCEPDDCISCGSQRRRNSITSSRAESSVKWFK